MAKVGHLFNKHVMKKVQESSTIYPDGFIQIGVQDKFDCPNCKTAIDLTGQGVTANMVFSCPNEDCNTRMMRWEIDSEVTHCHDCSVEFFTFRAWNDYVRKSHCRSCGRVFCGACLEFAAIPGAPVQVKACRTCRASLLAEEQAAAGGGLGFVVDSPIDTQTIKSPFAEPLSPAMSHSPAERIKADREARHSGEWTPKARPSKPRPKGLFDDDDLDPFAEQKQPARASRALSMFDVPVAASPDSPKAPAAGGLFDEISDIHASASTLAQSIEEPAKAKKANSD